MEAAAHIVCEIECRRFENLGPLESQVARTLGHPSFSLLILLLLLLMLLNIKLCVKP